MQVEDPRRPPSPVHRVRTGQFPINIAQILRIFDSTVQTV